MRIENIDATCQLITGATGLDPIHVFWIDTEPGRGYVTIICYGQAWTAYFGGMNGQTIREFFASTSTEYMLSKMGYGIHLKANLCNVGYLGRIIDAVRESLTLQDRAESTSNVVSIQG